MFGGSSGDDSNAVRRTIVFGLSIGIAFILLLVAGLVTKNWLGMIMILPLVMVPISMIVVEALGGGSAGTGVCSEVREMSISLTPITAVYRDWIINNSCQLWTVFLRVLALVFVWTAR